MHCFRRRRTPQLLSLAFSVLMLGACATPNPPSDPERDPWEGLNRKTFAVNEGLDLYLIEPVAKGYDFVVPEVLQIGVDNVFNNLSTPISAANNVLQLKPGPAVEDVARFLLNSSVGFGGLFDMATATGMPPADEDFGQTLGYWGVPPGPYLVLPLFGPSSPRDTVGLTVDSFSYVWGWFLPLYVTFPARTFDILNLRALYLEEIADNRESAFDYYVFVREAWIENRQKRVADEDPNAEDEDDLYYFEDEE